MAEGSSGRPAAGGKKRRPGQTAAKKKRPPQSGTGPTAAKPAAEQAQTERQLPWAMRRPLPPNYPGAKRPTPKPRTRRDRIDTISFDLDVLDPTVAPGVSNLAFGDEGFRMNEAARLLEGLRGLDVVGGDVVCIMPTKDAANRITAVNAAVILFEEICLIADRLAHQA
jgi:hypothetical protein